MPSKSSKAAKSGNAGSTSKGSGKAPSVGSRAWAAMVGNNRASASAKAGRPAGVNWD